MGRLLTRRIQHPGFDLGSKPSVTDWRSSWRGTRIALHGMGPGLADQISQGMAAGDEFRTAPLWGLGQRLFFLHDGRTNDLMQAIADHFSRTNPQFQAWEANAVIQNFNALGDSEKQALLNFLRSL